MENEPKVNSRLENNRDTSLYRHIGGRETCQRLSERFHDRIAHDLVLKEIFPKNLTHLTEWFALFIAERLGGPANYTATRGKQSLGCRHARLSIGSAEAERWLGHMFVAIDEVDATKPARQRLRDYFTETARTLTDPYLPLYGLPLDEMRTMLEQNPSLATASDHGRTLLSHAVRRWDLPRVMMLLEYHANVTIKDRLGHDPLHHAVTALAPASEAEGSAVVELLIQHGANVNEQSGPGQSSPLHVTARRGHAAIAEVLLEAGAEIEQRDSKGETPLRRAVNCGQIGMVRLLLSHGADPMSLDKKGRTVLAAARQEHIRDALHGVTRHL